mmetsp:Transcript_8824/g.13024  ORF Transcript_8824/g.13024 Transcript_8824/m.13024 type:complete len:86 (-) Transcript_8824:2345-2602(-)
MTFLDMQYCSTQRYTCQLDCNVKVFSQHNIPPSFVLLLSGPLPQCSATTDQHGPTTQLTNELLPETTESEYSQRSNKQRRVHREL